MSLQLQAGARSEGPQAVSVSANFSRYAAEYIACNSMRIIASARGSTPCYLASIVIDLHTTLYQHVHCVGDVVMTARSE
jgi:hypothetical protein